MVAEFDKKAMETKADVHPHTSSIPVGNNFQAFATEVESDIDVETEIETVEEASAEAEAHRALKWDVMQLPDLAERAKDSQPLLFLQELQVRVTLWLHSQALIISYGDLLGGFSNGSFADHLLALQGVVGFANWKLMYPSGTAVTESSIVPLDMRTVIQCALVKVQQQLAEDGLDGHTNTAKFQTVLRTRRKKPLKKK